MIFSPTVNEDNLVRKTNLLVLKKLNIAIRTSHLDPLMINHIEKIIDHIIYSEENDTCDSRWLKKTEETFPSLINSYLISTRCSDRTEHVRKTLNHLFPNYSNSCNPSNPNFFRTIRKINQTSNPEFNVWSCIKINDTCYLVSSILDKSFTVTNCLTGEKSNFPLTQEYELL